MSAPPAVARATASSPPITETRVAKRPRFGFFPVLVFDAAGVPSGQITKCGHSVRGRKAGITLDGAIEQPECLVFAVFRSLRAACQATEIEVVGIEASNRLAFGAFDLRLVVQWTREQIDAAKPHSPGGSYLNFPGVGADTHAVREAYGPNYDRLAKIKAEHDPANMFRMNQNIAPAP
jgi:hypothetical protein